MVLSFGNSGNGQFAVLVGFAALALAQVALDDNRHALLRVTLVIGHSDGNTVVLVHILAVRQGDGNIAALADGYSRVLDGASGFVVLDGDGQGPAVAVLILPAHGGVTVLIGRSGSAGDGDLPAGIGGVLAVVVVLVCHGDEQSLHGALVLAE